MLLTVDSAVDGRAGGEADLSVCVLCPISKCLLNRVTLNIREQNSGPPGGSLVLPPPGKFAQLQHDSQMFYDQT
eukprot:scaffold3992_cov141-Skeletonema_dohrnii-CCMP3373.AAC.10